MKPLARPLLVLALSFALGAVALSFHVAHADCYTDENGYTTCDNSSDQPPPLDTTNTNPEETPPPSSTNTEGCSYQTDGTGGGEWICPNGQTINGTNGETSYPPPDNSATETYPQTTSTPPSDTTPETPYQSDQTANTNYSYLYNGAYDTQVNAGNGQSITCSYPECQSGSNCHSSEECDGASSEVCGVCEGTGGGTTPPSSNTNPQNPNSNSQNPSTTQALQCSAPECAGASGCSSGYTCENPSATSCGECLENVNDKGQIALTPDQACSGHGGSMTSNGVTTYCADGSIQPLTQQSNSYGQVPNSSLTNTSYGQVPNAGSGSGLFNPLGSGASIPTFIANVLSIITTVVGPVIIVLMLVYSGFLFVTAQGNASKIEEARRALLWTVVGALILLGAQVIASVIQSTVSGLAGGS